MDIVVSISEYKSLSQSDLISRNLFATLQIGRTVHESSGINVEKASFRSGSAEIPLVLTIKNRQTNTVMYVRNVPMSSVLESSGLREQWIAVYPPGDPQNLHFDASVVPSQACAQVRLSITIEEEPLSGSMANAPEAFSGNGGWGSTNFSPGPRLSVLEDSHDDGRMDELRRSIAILKVDPKDSRETVGVGATTSPRSGPSGRFTLPPNAGSDINNLPPTRQSSLAAPAPVFDIKEKEQQAQRIKERVAEMANAQRRAQDVSRTLQENLDLLAELRRQLKRTEADLVEKRNDTQKLENDRMQLADEEAAVKQQIVERDQLFQELRGQRDEIDRELSQVLNEQGRQKNALEVSMKNFKLQEKIISQDLDESKRQVTQLKTTLESHEKAMREKEEAWQAQERVRVAREAAERENIEKELDQSRASLNDAKASKESNLMKLLEVQRGHVEVTTKLSAIQEEISNLQSEGSDSPVRSTVADASAVLEQKKAKLIEQTIHVEKLEKELEENRDQLLAQSTRIANVHVEAQEHELSSQRVAGKKSVLEMQLEEKARETQLAVSESQEQKAKMAEAQQESAKRKEELQRLEQEAAGSRDRNSRLTQELRKTVEDKTGELENVKQRVLDLKKGCDDLEQTRSSRRVFLEDCVAALSAAQARAKDLEEELAGSEADLAVANKEAIALEEEEACRGAALEEAKRQLAEQEGEIQRLQAAAEGSGDSDARIAELDATSQGLSSDITKTVEVGAKTQAEHQRLQAELKSSELAHEQAKGVLQNLGEEKEARRREVDELTQEQESLNLKLEKGNRELERLQQASDAKKNELESTTLKVKTIQQEIEGTAAARMKEVKTLEEEAISLEAANAESDAASKKISEQVQEMERRRTDVVEALATSQAEKTVLESEIEEARKATELLLQESAKALAEVSEASHTAAGGDNQKQNEKESEEATEALHQELKAETENLQRMKDEAQIRLKKLAGHKSELDHLEAQQRTCLEEIRKLEIEKSQLEERAKLGSPPGEAQGNEEQCLALRKELEVLKASTAEALKASADPQVQQAVREREESLEQVSNQLNQAQAAVRTRRASEEELKTMIQKLKDKMQAAGDKATYQVEHSKIQLETIQRLEEQKRKQEEELEVLTLALHDQEQQNEQLDEEVKALQLQVEAAYPGHLREGDLDAPEEKVAEEEARFKAEIAFWKERSELKRTEKTGQLDMMKQQQQATVESLQERIASLQKEVGDRDEIVRSWQEEISRRRGAGADATALPGLVVSQRPLPMNHQRRKALLVGVNYISSHAPLKGCVNDVWNIQCLLRYTLQYSAEQMRVLVDSSDGRQRPDRAPTMANILAGLQWLVSGAQPGDHLLFFFSGYGAQHPRALGSDKCEGYLVPSDFAEDLPANFFEAVEQSLAESKGAAKAAALDPAAASGGENGGGSLDESCRLVAAAKAARGNSEAGYRLLSLLEVRDFFCQLPKSCNASISFDCCYSVLPGVGPRSNCPATFPRVQRGKVEYSKLRDFISRPRFLELPTLPVQHTPGHFPRSNAFPACTLHCYSGCRLKEWCAEFPIEGTVQGAFTWAFIKALAQGHFHCGLQQLQQLIVHLVNGLQAQFHGVEQLPVVQHSEAASLQDVVLFT